MPEASDTCNRCGAATPPAAAFCAACGTKLNTMPAWQAASGGRGPAGYPPPPPPPGYTAYPAYPQPYSAPVQRGTNGMSVASLILGILWISGLGSILALVFGYIGKRQCEERNEGGRGMAIAGIVLGWIGIVGVLLIILIAVIAAASTSGSTS